MTAIRPGPRPFLSPHRLWPYLWLGVVQGLAFWLLKEAVGHKAWPGTDGRALAACVYLVLAA